MIAFTEAERQILMTLAVLEHDSVLVEPDNALSLGRAFFGMYFVDWSGVAERLEQAGLMRVEPPGWSFTDAGRTAAAQCQLEKPLHIYFYDEFFTRVQTSRAHTLFCERTYGRDLSQHGMMDMAQLERLVKELGIGSQSSVLELGCGNGRMAEWISDQTGAQVTGVDTSQVGIQQAQAHTADRRGRLDFVCGDVLRVDLPLACFDIFLAIDMLYFVPDLDGLFERMTAWATPAARVGVFYSAWVAADGDLTLLRPERTRLGEMLRRRGLNYRVVDFSQDEAAHWTRKLQAAEELRSAFEGEGNLFLYEKRIAEARQHQQYVQSGRVSRYLYVIDLPNH